MHLRYGKLKKTQLWEVTNGWLHSLMLLSLKPATQAQVGKLSCLWIAFELHKQFCATENWRKRNSGKQPTVDCLLKPNQSSGVEHIVTKVIPHSNMDPQETPCKLKLSAPWYFRLKWMSCVRPQLVECPTLVEADGSSLNRQWFEYELTLHNIHSTVTWRRSDIHKKHW